MTEYRKGSVRSADGTTIGYRHLGGGPAILLVHGGMQAAQNLMKLARILATEFTVHVPDRRGRGLSGPHGVDYGMAREVEDLQALVAATGATRVFGLSSGGLATLRTALVTPAIERVALYEPPLSIDGSAPTDWLDRFDREVADGRLAAALVSVFKGLGTEPVLSRLPRCVFVPAMAVGMRAMGRGGRQAPPDEVPIPALIPTEHFDICLIREVADTLAEYAALDTPTLLLGGAKSPAFLSFALDQLAGTLPRVRRITFDGLGHSGPDDDGDPARVAEVLRGFFRAAND